MSDKTMQAERLIDDWLIAEIGDDGEVGMLHPQSRAELSRLIAAALKSAEAEGARIENEACAQICNRVSDGWEENAMVCRNLILARQQPPRGAK